MNTSINVLIRIKIQMIFKNFKESVPISCDTSIILFVVFISRYAKILNVHRSLK